MYNQILQTLLTFYGLFLISCGITAVIFIGMKAKTALVSGGTSGCVSIFIGYLNGIGGNPAYQYLGILLAAALFVVFSWRTTKTLFSLSEMIQSSHPDTKGKAIAFLIISLMAIVSLGIFGAQIIISILR